MREYLWRLAADPVIQLCANVVLLGLGGLAVAIWAWDPLAAWVRKSVGRELDNRPRGWL